MPADGHQPVRMMVEDGTLKPAPSEDELHPASVPVAGATATLTVAGVGEDEGDRDNHPSPAARSAGAADRPVHNPANR